MDIRKVVIPVAGWGTRSLPASKNIPKEMLPVYNKPVVQYVVEEAMRGGVEDVVFVTNRDKGGHAVLCAKEMVKGESFAVMVGDDFMIGEGAGLEQLVKVASEHDMPVIGVMEVPADKVNRYGIVMGEEITPGVYNITDMVEKPAVGTVDSRLAIVGRYVLTPDIFEHLERVKPGHGGEIQLTDALATLAKERGMLAVKMGGIRFDAGDWVDYLSANIYFGLRDEALCEPLKARLREMLG